MNKTVNLKGIEIFKNDEIELAPLTLITGINNSGKTTILNTIQKQFNDTQYYKWSGLSIFSKNFANKKHEILLLNQPEAGLHPKLQLEMADIILNHVKIVENVVVETHSDHMINRLVRRMMEDKSLMKLIKIYFVDQDEDGVSNIQDIVVDPVNGAICDNPNFFYQFALETEKIINAAYENQKMIS